MERDFDYIEYNNGMPIKARKDKINDDNTVFDADDFARSWGFDTFMDYLSSDYGLDFISEWKRDNPGIPVIGRYGSNALLEVCDEEFNKYIFNQ